MRYSCTFVALPRNIDHVKEGKTCFDYECEQSPETVQSHIARSCTRTATKRYWWSFQKPEKEALHVDQWCPRCHMFAFGVLGVAKDFYTYVPTCSYSRFHIDNYTYNMRRHGDFLLRFDRLYREIDEACIESISAAIRDKNMTLPLMPPNDLSGYLQLRKTLDWLTKWRSVEDVRIVFYTH
jgi:hypothetical protein